jgi:hypothetical protein
LIIRTYARVAAMKSAHVQMMPRAPMPQIAALFAAEAR